MRGKKHKKWKKIQNLKKKKKKKRKKKKKKKKKKKINPTMYWTIDNFLNNLKSNVMQLHESFI